MEYRYKPTTHGRNVMAACMALGNKPFCITRVAFGSGKVEEGVNLADVHQLLAYVTDGAIAERRHEDDRLYLTLQYTNSEHKDVKTFLLSEFMIFVTDPVTGEETDFVYGSLGDYRQPVPAYNPAFPISVFNFPLTMILSDEINVTVSAPAGLVTHGELADLINATAIRREDITIPATGWAGGGVGRYPYYKDVPVEGTKEHLIPCLTILPVGEESAYACGLAPYVQTLEGAVRIFAASVPAAAIPASLTLQGDAAGYCRVGTGDNIYRIPPATANSIGAVKPGSGLIIAPDGTLSVDTASEAEINQILGEALAPN